MKRLFLKISLYLSIALGLLISIKSLPCNWGKCTLNEFQIKLEREYFQENMIMYRGKIKSADGRISNFGMDKASEINSPVYSKENTLWRSLGFPTYKYLLCVENFTSLENGIVVPDEILLTLNLPFEDDCAHDQCRIIAEENGCLEIPDPFKMKFINYSFDLLASTVNNPYDKIPLLMEAKTATIVFSESNTSFSIAFKVDHSYAFFISFFSTSAIISGLLAIIIEITFDVFSILRFCKKALS